MSRILLLLMALLMVSCQFLSNENKIVSEAQTAVENPLVNFDWLLGKWQRNNEDPGKETFENWIKISPTEYTGIGFTMQANDTVKQEQIRLIQKNKQWLLEVKTLEDTKATSFKMISFSKDTFTCENNDIDFPNRIKYWKNGTKINASVAGGDFEIAFEFEKL